MKDGQKCKEEEEEETTLGANGILGETTRYLSLSESAVVSVVRTALAIIYNVVGRQSNLAIGLLSVLMKSISLFADSFSNILFKYL